ncbi:UDP-phosphate alpha-4-amino-4-deoxy-L-arabinose arabinosyl transferase [Antarcticibacterium flavum]|uniref:UDP-phosphate alpha-4-amino-4-deoxy-L-arabinose arabinosyl transferase n=2 Tax=Flavobacteriaceae TaxID=49546 RepID=A0A5B7X8F3_9FLAO|nr:UDP-phosphate alpha-4-amino-4-deoxy-L-arabinose arabinosyl transferase [Antarcticibacterium sp. W02-3]QCY71360.1 UDP-phosphate alpha-4-amino-4-deoxy-L-arabinose arabinosyl transferase [Antarcticibacterium flavum]
MNLDALFVNIMEARNFITAREMLVHDNWIFTTMNEMPRYQKPPLPTWLTAISAGIFGEESLYAYRLPAALASLFLMWIFYRIQLELKLHKSLAFLSSLILITSFYVFFAGREGQWDIFTHSFMAGSIFFLIRLLKKPDEDYKNAVYAGLFLGASLMSKGPVSVYALFLPFLISYAFTFRFKNLQLKWKSLLLMVVIGLLTGGWWTLLVHYYDPAEFTRIAEVESDRWFNYNVRPFYYYWSFFTQSGIWTIPALMGLGYWYLKPKISKPGAYKFFFLWVVCSVVLLSIIPEKKSRYLLPVLIPLATTTGFYAEYVIKNFKNKFKVLEKIPVYFNFVVLIIISLAIPVTLVVIAGTEILEMKWTFFIFSILMLGCALAFIYALIKKNMKLLFGLQVSLMIIIIAAGFPLLKLINPERNSPNVAHIKELSIKENLKVYDYKSMLPELVWHFGTSIPQVLEKTPAPTAKRFLLLVEESAFPEWKKDFPEYKTEALGVLDLNPVHQTGTNNRLIRNYYLLILQEP